MFENSSKNNEEVVIRLAPMTDFFLFQSSISGLYATQEKEIQECKFGCETELCKK